MSNGATEPGAPGSAVACTTEQTVLGEGVRWDARRDELLRVDILTGRVYRDRVAEDGALVPVRTYEVPGTVGAVAPIEGDEGWLLAAGRGFAHLEPGRKRAPARRAGPGRDADERRCLRPAGPLLGRHAGRRPPVRRRRALPARPGRADLAGARRPDDRQRHRLEPGRPHDVPGGQRAAGDPRVRLRARHGGDLRRTGAGRDRPSRSDRRTA